MKKSRFIEEQRAFSLKQIELGTTVSEFCHKLPQVKTLSSVDSIDAATPIRGSH
ncbi:hypothetical protein CH64_153 [Yersinia rohdei]|uniref:Transposase n=1 Tax=Yersinia rohdei TaxID=29485 RepID=A0ABM5S9H1_YERRO|nr:hypothetical protein CH64_153 [Yersinia rohdei]